MKTLPFIIALIFMISSCKKVEVQKDEIKYEIISTLSAPMEIDYGNQFGNINQENYTGSTWTKTIDASQASNFQVSVTQFVSQNIGTHTITVRIYYKGELVDEVINDVTNTVDYGYDLYGASIFYK